MSPKIYTTPTLRLSHVQIALSALALSVVVVGTTYAQDTDNSVSDTQASLTLTPSGVSLNMVSCADLAAEEEFTLSGTYNNPSLTVNYTTRLVATTGSSCTHEDVCNFAPLDDGGCSCLKEVSGAPSASVSFTVEELFTEPCVEGSDQTISFFLHYTETEADPLIGLNPIEAESQAVRLPVDLNPPSAPTEAPRVTPAEDALVINAPEISGDAVRYEACVWLDDGEDRADAVCREVNAGSNDRFENLMNDSLYNVIYIAYDDADNPSGDSPTAQGTPASVLDFAEVYSGEYPGGERGGCDAKMRSRGPLSGGALLSALLLSILLLLSLLIRSKRIARLRAVKTQAHSGLMLSICLALALGAGVSGVDRAHADPLSVKRTSRTSTVTLSGGAYQPRIDDEFTPRAGVKRPYERVFQDQSPLMLQIQLERHILQTHGLLSVGASMGTWSVEGDGLSVTTTTEKTEMSITPFTLYTGYRFDLFQDIVPIVPSLKLGIAYYTWNIYNGSGDVASFSDGSEASGGTMGWFYSIGLHLLLDFLDREMAWAFDRDAGVNHSYLSVEYQSSRVDDFGDPDSFRLGNDIFFFGVTLDL